MVNGENRWKDRYAGQWQAAAGEVKLDTFIASAADREKELDHMWYPGIEAGVEGVRWVENCVRSADKGAVWLDYQ